MLIQVSEIRLNQFQLNKKYKLINYICPFQDSTEDGEKKKEIYIPQHKDKEDSDLFDHVGEGINFVKFVNIPVQVSGENIPEPLKKFSDIAKHPSVIEAIKKSEYHTLTPVQKYGMPIIAGDRDLMASATTGSVCKSFYFT